MNFLESVQMAGKTLLSNKLRSALTMLGIVIGNASVIGMIGIGEGGQKYVAKELQSLGPNVLFVIPGNQETQRITRDFPKTLVYADALAIASQVPTVAGVTSTRACGCNRSAGTGLPYWLNRSPCVSLNRATSLELRADLRCGFINGVPSVPVKNFASLVKSLFVRRTGIISPASIEPIRVR